MMRVDDAAGAAAPAGTGPIMEGDMRAMDMTATASVKRRTSAWAVHAFTASGVAFGLMALIRVIEGNAEATLLWLGAALVVDGLDGFFARKVGVKEVLPHFDGAILDLVIDYLNYVVVPAIFLYRFGLLPDRLGIAGAVFILLTSLYCFSNVNMKSGDNYFVGFPAIWNVLALYLFVAQFNTTINAMIVAVIGVLTFTTVKFLHPFRVRR